MAEKPFTLRTVTTQVTREVIEQQLSMAEREYVSNQVLYDTAVDEQERNGRRDFLEASKARVEALQAKLDELPNE